MHDLMIALVPMAGAVSMVQLKDRLRCKTSTLPLALAPILPVAPLSFSAVMGSVVITWLVYGKR